MSSTLDPYDETKSEETESLPNEEHIDAAKVDEQLETEPEEAENFTDGYAPEDDDAEVIAVEDLED